MRRKTLSCVDLEDLHEEFWNAHHHHKLECQRPPCPVAAVPSPSRLEWGFFRNLAVLFNSYSFWTLAVFWRCAADTRQGPLRRSSVHISTMHGGVAPSGDGHCLCRRPARGQRPSSTAGVSHKKLQHGNAWVETSGGGGGRWWT